MKRNYVRVRDILLKTVQVSGRHFSTGTEKLLICALKLDADLNIILIPGLLSGIVILMSLPLWETLCQCKCFRDKQEQRASLGTFTHQQIIYLVNQRPYFHYISLMLLVGEQRIYRGEFNLVTSLHGSF